MLDEHGQAGGAVRGETAKSEDVRERLQVSATVRRDLGAASNPADPAPIRQALKPRYPFSRIQLSDETSSVFRCAEPGLPRKASNNESALVRALRQRATARCSKFHLDT